MIKKCSVCKKLKEESEFNKRGLKYQSECKDCHNEFCKNHYKNNKNFYYERNKKRNLSLRNFIESYKINKKCVDCKISYPPYVMDFDHLKDKEYNVAEMYQKGFGIKKIKKEIDKCELVCSNCHRIRTYNRKNSKVV